MSRRRLIFLALPICVFLAGCIVSRFMGYAINPRLSPNWGTVPIAGLKGEARIYRDKFGIPHIAADNEGDMFFAVGYAQAMDRLFEMDIMRHFIEGRVSEILGDMKLSMEPVNPFSTTLEMDRANRIIGLKYLGEAGAELMRVYRPDTYHVLQRYSDGVNAAIDEMVANKSLPLECKMLDYVPEYWKPADTVSVSRFIGWTLGSNMDQELLRYAIAQKIGPEKAMELLPKYKKITPDIPTIIPRELVDYRNLKPLRPPEAGDAESLAPIDPKFLAGLVDHMQGLTHMVSDGAASNNWVVGSKKSASGKPILANDPHLGHMMPSLFWTMHVTGAGYDCYGVTFPGMPVIVLGHTPHVAWGLTTSGADVQDVYIETVNPDNPNQYLYKGKWEDFTIRKEILKVRKSMTGPMGKSVEIDVRLSRHGPIINSISGGLKDDAPPLAMRWTGYDMTTDTGLAHALITSSTVEEFIRRAGEMKTQEAYSEADSMMILMKARNMDDFKRAVSTYALPNQNWVFADDSGNFGYVAAGRVPLRTHHDGSMPVDGSSGKYDWYAFIPFEHLPQVWNPERGYVATANNEVVPADDYPYPFVYGYMPGYRAARIEELLRAKDKLDVDDMARIQNDVYMVQARIMLPIFQKEMEGMEGLGVDDKAALDMLKKWDYQATTDSVASTIFHEWVRQISHGMIEDEIGDLWGSLSREYFSKATIDYMIVNDTPFFDDIRTTEKETRRDVVQSSFKMTMASLRKTLGGDMTKWNWGRLHTITFASYVGIGPLAKYLNYGPLPHSGSSETVRAAAYNGFGDHGWQTMGGPCLRHIADMAHLESGPFVIDGGESGQWKSPHYTDGVEAWYQGKYFEAIMDMSVVTKEPRGLVILTPMPKK